MVVLGTLAGLAVLRAAAASADATGLVQTGTIVGASRHDFAAQGSRLDFSTIDLSNTADLENMARQLAAMRNEVEVVREMKQKDPAALAGLTSSASMLDAAGMSTLAVKIRTHLKAGTTTELDATALSAQFEAFRSKVEGGSAGNVSYVLPHYVTSEGDRCVEGPELFLRVMLYQVTKQFPWTAKEVAETPFGRGTCKDQGFTEFVCEETGCACFPRAITYTTPALKKVWREREEAQAEKKKKEFTEKTGKSEHEFMVGLYHMCSAH